MRTFDKFFSVITCVGGITLIIVAIAASAWIHLALGGGLLLLSAAYNRESKRA